jgi:hypothetical protein
MIDQFLVSARFVLMSLFISWINMEDFAMFDTALCNLETRPLFLFELHITVAPFCGVKRHKVTKDFLKWLSLRSISVEEIVLNNTILHQIRNGDTTAISLPFLHSLNFPFNLKCNMHIGSVVLCLLTSKLRNFVSNDSTLVDDSVGAILAERCTNLTHCDFSNTDISCVSFEKLAANNIDLRHVNISNTLIRDNGLLMLIDTCGGRYLQTLQMPDCANIMDSSMSLISKCHCLTSLNIRWCVVTSLETIQEIISGCSKLTDLNVGCCEEILCDAFLIYLAVNAKGLKSLHIDNCEMLCRNAPEITDMGIQALCSGCILIESINVSNNRLLSVESALNIALKMANLAHVEFKNVGVTAEQTKLFVLFFMSFGTIEVLDTVNWILSGTALSSKGVDLRNSIQLAIDTMKNFGGIKPKEKSSVGYALIESLLRGCKDDVIVQLREVKLLMTKPKLSCNVFCFEYFHAISELTLQAHGFTANSFDNIALYCKRLSKFSLSNCPDVSDSGIFTLIDNNRVTLEMFYCDSCQLLSDSSVIYLADACYKTLTYFHMVECKTDYYSAQYLLRKCPLVTHFEFTYDDDEFWGLSTTEDLLNSSHVLSTLKISPSKNTLNCMYKMSLLMKKKN